jgi:hypothetical protein
MQITKTQWLRLGITGAAVLLVGWGMWRCQGHSIGQLTPVWSTRRYAEMSDYGWPMFHTHEVASWDMPTRYPYTPTNAQHDRTSIFPGIVVDVCVWCLAVLGTACVVWRWTAHARQWSLRTVFGVFCVVAVLLGWWRTEYNIAIKVVPPRYPELYTVYAEAPMLTLLQSPWYVYVPVLFGLGCGIYWVGWIGGAIAAKIIGRIRHVAMSKLR